MISPSPKPTYVLVFLFAIFLQFSCSKDSDLLAEYVIVDSQSTLVEIKVMAIINEPVVIDVINDGENAIVGGESATVTEVSESTIGTATINPDNTITYTPDTEATGTDSFSYSTETTNPDATVTTSSGSVKVTISSEINYWKTLFDIAWSSDYAKAVEKSKSGNKFQEYYHMAYSLDGLIEIWQATGDFKYLDDALYLINNMISSAKPVQNGKFLGWPTDSTYGESYALNGVALWESYVWKHVATLARIMFQSPELLKNAKYKNEYENILAFSEKHIFEKWYSKTEEHRDIYRVNAHMASHWARIGMELFIITGKQVYKTVFDNVSFAGLPNYSGASLRSRFYKNISKPSATSWYQKWDAPKVEDTSHGADVIAFFVTAHENKMYWNAADIQGLVNCLNDVVWTKNNPLEFTANVDGSGGSSKDDAGFHFFITLGRFDQNLQNRIKQYYTNSNVLFQRSQAFGVAALNSAILANGKPIYPENY